MMGASRADIERYAGRAPRSLRTSSRIVLDNFGLQATLVYRFGRSLLRAARSPWVLLTLPLWPLYWIASVAIRKCYGIRLALSADIGPGLYIGHLGGIVVERCTMGSECSIAQQTRISGPPNSQRALCIGSRVWIGAHAQLVGALRIGDGATIGAGSRVKADVLAHSLVMGNPARCINTAYDNTPFLFPRAGGP